MLFNGQHGCGASIISANHILTAAHCCVNAKQNTLESYGVTFVIGEHDFRNSTSHERTVNPLEYILHPEYKAKEMKYDFCVVKTDCMDLDDSTRDVVCLPSQGEHVAPNDDYINGPDCYTAGWGALQDKGHYPSKLQSTSVKVFSNDYCVKTSYYTHRDLMWGEAFCAGYIDGERDACQGDSGGPLVCVEGNVTVLYGIVSYGYGCADKDYPGIYSMVASQIDWLSQVVGKFV